MEYFKQEEKYTVKQSYLHQFLEAFWFIPSDVLQRAMEANIWDMCRFKSPILDIGIGNGEITKYLFKKHPVMDVGIDIDDSQFAHARATKRYKKVLCVNAESMPFKNASFSTVVSNSTFEHIKQDRKAVNEVARVLKKNGLFFLTIPSEFLQKWIFEYEEKRDIKKAKKIVDKFNERVFHLHYYSFSEWEKIFKEADMHIVFSRYYFPKRVALLWYKLFKIFTYKINERELWSYIGHSKMTKLLPEKLIIFLLQHLVLQKPYNVGFFQDNEKGAQLFIIAKKI